MSTAHPLRAKYADQLPTLAAIFPDWQDDDLLFALDDAKGSLELAVDRISEGQSHLSLSLSLPLPSPTTPWARITTTRLHRARLRSHATALSAWACWPKGRRRAQGSSSSSRGLKEGARP